MFIIVTKENKKERSIIRVEDITSVTDSGEGYTSIVLKHQVCALLVSETAKEVMASLDKAVNMNALRSQSDFLSLTLRLDTASRILLHKNQVSSIKEQDDGCIVYGLEAEHWNVKETFDQVQAML